jgi:hypothetical protein
MRQPAWLSGRRSRRTSRSAPRAIDEWATHLRPKTDAHPNVKALLLGGPRTVLPPSGGCRSIDAIDDRTIDYKANGPERMVVKTGKESSYL